MKKIISSKKEFNKLIKKDKFQIFLFTSPVTIPLQFAVHSWIVTSKKGKIKRWDVWQEKELTKKSWGYLYLNVIPPEMGVNTYPTRRMPRNKSTLIDYVEGDLAKKMIAFIEKNAENYPFKSRYKLYPGPNSNTFPQWIINKFPETKWKLPWNAFGKNYISKL